MTRRLTPQCIDPWARFFLYLLIFWLPYGKSVIEFSVAVALSLWIIKRIWLFCQNAPRPFSLRRLLPGFKPEHTPLNQPISFFLATCLLSSVLSFFWERAMRGFFAKTLEWFVIFFLVVEFFKEKKHIYTALGILLFTAVASSFDCFQQYYWTGKDIFLGRPLTMDGRATAAFSHPNSLGGFLIMVIPVVFSGLFLKKAVSYKAVFAVILLVLVWSLILTFSRASWIGVILSILFFMFVAMKKLFMKAIVIMGLAGVILGGVFISSTELRKDFRLSHEIISMTTNWRWHLWKDSFVMIQEKPLLGHGLNTYMVLFQEYRGQTSGVPGQTWDPTYAHNTYVQLTTETGLLGLGMFLWLLMRIFSSSLEFSRKADCRETRIVLLGCLAGIFAFLVHSFAENNFYSLQLSSLFWFMVGIIFSSGKLLSKEDSYGIKNVLQNNII